MCVFVLSWGERKRERKMALHHVTMSGKVFSCIYLNVKANTSAHTLFDTNWTWVSMASTIYTYICTNRLFEDVNHRTVKHSNIVSLSLSLSLFLELLTLWSVLVWHFSPRPASELHAGACIFFRCRNKTLFVFTTVILYGAHPVSWPKRT